MAKKSKSQTKLTVDIDLLNVVGSKSKRKFTVKSLENMVNATLFSALPPLPVEVKVRMTLSSITGRTMDQILPTTRLDNLPPIPNLASDMTAVVRTYREGAKALVTSDFSSSMTILDVIKIVSVRIDSDTQPLPVEVKVRMTLSSITGRPMDQILPTTRLDNLPPIPNLASNMTVVVRTYRAGAKALTASNFGSAKTVLDVVKIVSARIDSGTKP